MPTLTINGTEVSVENGSTILQACEAAGVEIPRFCYHERLEIAGNCRMCLVEVEGGPPKPTASCAMPAGDGMVVRTDSAMVKKAREGVMEFLLINHPLDCPICDQGGECDLQDQAMAYGKGKSRFTENKRAVQDKYMGPLIKTHMTRCIHCTRCVRFSSDVAGASELGAVNRGEDTEITTYIEHAVTSELSGNMIDLCPVGALTSKPYAFNARSWELSHTESIDVLDAVGSNIRIDSRGKQVMRMLPRLNEAVNEEWISDKTRFAYDGLTSQRLDRCYVRKNNTLQAASWEEALQAIARKMEHTDGNAIAALAGDLTDCESMLVMKELMESLGSPHIDCRQDGALLGGEVRASYLFNSTIAGIEQADACLLIGTNPRTEAPIIAARLQKRQFGSNDFPVASIGDPVALPFHHQSLGNHTNLLKQIAEGTHPFAEVLKSAKRPMLILGSAVAVREDAASVFGMARIIAENYGLVTEEWNGFNVLQRAASRVGGMDIGFLPAKGGKATQEIINAAHQGDVSLLFLLGADEIDMSQLGKAFVVYMGHHGDAGAHRADVILPTAAYTEKTATYVNTEGRVQRTQPAIAPLGEAKSDWLAIVALAEALGKPLPYQHVEAVRSRFIEIASHFSQVGGVIPAAWEAFGRKTGMKAAPFAYPVENFYMTDAISRASKTMAECTQAMKESPLINKAA